MRLTLRDLGLSYVIQDEVLLITTAEAADCKLAARIYPVADLVATGRDEKGDLAADFDSLEDLIRSTVQSSSWDEVGGPGSMAHLRNGDLLVVSQTQEIQDDVAGLLGARVKSRRPRPAGKCPPPWTCPGAARPSRRSPAP